jgi:hypothetical protein
VWPVRYDSSDVVDEAVVLDASLDIDSARTDVVEAVLSTLDLRRKGSDGTRYVGNRAGGDGIDGNGGIVSYFSMLPRI